MHAHLSKLETLGVLKRDPTKPRAMEVWSSAPSARCAPTGLPLVGQVAAGAPILAEENVEEYLQVPDVIGGEAGDYILRVRGESMMDAGILEGDFVVVRPADDADNGEIVVALVGDEEATVKRFFREKDHVRLQPENKSMKPIRTRDAQRARPRRRGVPEGLVSAIALATETAAVARRSQGHSSARLFEPSGSTLEDIVLGAWEDLAARRPHRMPRLRWRARASAAAPPAAPSSPDAQPRVRTAPRTERFAAAALEATIHRVS